MSRTELYIIKNDGSIELYKEFGNSHRGASLLWNHLFDNYLKDEENQYFWELMDEEEDKFWRLDINKQVPRELRLMLASTYENVVVKKENLLLFANAIEYITHQGYFRDGGHWNDYPEVLREISDLDNVIGIAWKQTSVNWESWWQLEKTEEGYIGRENYNFLTGEDHMYLFEYLDYMENEYVKVIR